MTRQRYDKKEAINRILRSLEGEPIYSDAPNTLIGDVLSENEALSDIAEIMEGSLPGEAGIVPVGIRARPSVYSDSKQFYVIPDHANASDANTGENPAFPLATIQQGVTNTRAYRDDVIWVTCSDSWQYGTMTENGIIESVTIPITKPGIAIIGVGAGSNGVYWQPTGSAGWCIVNNALDVEIAGFCFWSSAGTCNGIQCNWAGANTSYGENFLIHDNVFTDDVNTGIQLEYTWYGKIYRNYFQDCNYYGILSSFSGQGVSYLHIENNTFSNVIGTAICLTNCDSSFIAGNTFASEYAYTGTADALFINFASGSSSYNTITDNKFTCDKKPGTTDDGCIFSLTDAVLNDNAYIA